LHLVWEICCFWRKEEVEVELVEVENVYDNMYSELAE
jgi:hypothetical protein